MLYGLAVAILAVPMRVTARKYLRHCALWLDGGNIGIADDHRLSISGKAIWLSMGIASSRLCLAPHSGVGLLQGQCYSHDRAYLLMSSELSLQLGLCCTSAERLLHPCSHPRSQHWLPWHSPQS